MICGSDYKRPIFCSNPPSLGGFVPGTAGESNLAFNLSGTNSHNDAPYSLISRSEPKQDDIQTAAVSGGIKRDGGFKSVAWYVIWIFLCLMINSRLRAADKGIAVKANKHGHFEYTDNFETMKFLNDAFVKGQFHAYNWQAGQIQNHGPGSLSLIYRFHADGRAIRQFNVRISQRANSLNLGGYNSVLLSSNGLDWTLFASSRPLKADDAGWQTGTLTVTSALPKAAGLLGRDELWLRLDLGNFSGLPGGISSSISNLQVSLVLGGVGSGKINSRSEAERKARTLWGRTYEQSGWRGLLLDAGDPAASRPPHYYEDADGWLYPAGASSPLAIDETNGFFIQDNQGYAKALPLSLACFVAGSVTKGTLAARITVRAMRDGSRKMQVFWDGRLVGTFDTATYFRQDRNCFVVLPALGKSSPHELRIIGSDGLPILVRQIAIVSSSGTLRWTTKPGLPLGGALKLLGAWYMPDPAPPAHSQTVEHKLQKLYQEHADFGALRIVVRNNSKVPVRIADRMDLDGKLTRAQYVNFVTSAWDAPGVIWYRVRPRLLKPGACSQFYIRFRRRLPGNAAKVRIYLDNGHSLDVNVLYQDPGLRIDYVTTGARSNRLYVYVRRKAGYKARLISLYLDGKKLSHVKIYGDDFPGNVALAVAHLRQPLVEGSYHIVRAITTVQGVGRSIAAQFRVLPFFFPRSSFDTPPDLLHPMNMNLFMAPGWSQPLDVCRKYDIYEAVAAVSEAHARVRYILGPDEPDAHDNPGGGYTRGLGYNARRLAQSHWQQFLERSAPRAVSWIIMDGTTRPLNWAVYGQFADISCFDPYPITYYGADHAYVRESLTLARECGAPHRMYACLEAYGFSSGQGVPPRARGPIPAEYRQNFVQAIGAGAKGLTSWVYARGAGGWELSPPLKNEIARDNALIRNIQSDLLLGSPIDLALDDAGLVKTGTVDKERWLKDRVWVNALLCGPNTIVLAVANHIPASKPNPPTIKPAKNVTIRVTLPSYLPTVTAFEDTGTGLVPRKCRISHGEVAIKLNTVESGRILVLRRSNNKPSK